MTLYYISQLQPQPFVGISEKVAGSVLFGWASKKHDGDWQSIREQRQARGFLKGPST